MITTLVLKASLFSVSFYLSSLSYKFFIKQTLELLPEFFLTPYWAENSFCFNFRWGQDMYDIETPIFLSSSILHNRPMVRNYLFSFLGSLLLFLCSLSLVSLREDTLTFSNYPVRQRFSSIALEQIWFSCIKDLSCQDKSFSSIHFLHK